MDSLLELYLQGGLGNQLIQMAYAESLHARTGICTRINPILLHPLVSRVRLVSPRVRAFKSLDLPYTVPDSPTRLGSFFRLLKLYYSSNLLSDNSSDKEIVHQISIAKPGSTISLCGYFQRRAAFGFYAKTFWQNVKTQLLQKYSLTPFPRGQVVVHIRLGDYLRTNNQKTYAQYPLQRRLLDAQEWAQSLGGAKTVHIVTDEAVYLKRVLEISCKEGFEIYRGENAEEDFIFMTRHRHIFGCNSTFSLCSGMLSSQLWNEAKTLKIPKRWFVDLQRNESMIDELACCSFITWAEEGDIGPTNLTSVLIKP